MSAPASTINWWGRAYELTVYTTQDGSGTAAAVLSCNAWEPEALRITFDINETAVQSPWWFGEICVYNMNDSSIQSALFNAQWVTLKAGYQSVAVQNESGQSPLGIIWSGCVMQVLYERESVIDNKITFHCLATNTKLSRGLNFSMGPLATQAQVVSRMVGAVPTDVVITPMPEELANNQYVRARTLFGITDKYFAQISLGNDMTWFRTTKGVQIGQLISASQTPDLVYSVPPPQSPPLPANWNNPTSTTTYTILGSPQQTDSGVIFRVLLDPRLIVKLPALLVRIDNTVIRQMKANIPQAPLIPLDVDNSYVVGSVRHRGDSRGNDWYSEVTGWTRQYALNGLRGIFLTGQ